MHFFCMKYLSNYSSRKAPQEKIKLLGRGDDDNGRAKKKERVIMQKGHEVLSKNFHIRGKEKEGKE